MPTFGYPDWSRPNVGISIPVIQDLLLLTTGGKDYGEIYVGNWPYLAVYVQHNDNAVFANMNLNWATSAIGDVPSGAQEFTCAPANYMSFTVPCKAPYVDVTINSNVNAANNNTQVLVYGTSASAGAMDVTTNHRTLLQDASAYLANQAKTFSLENWHWGECQVTAFTITGGAALVTFQYFNWLSQTWVEFAATAAMGLGTSVPTRVELVPNPVRVVVENQGTAQNIAVEIVPVLSGTR
jgi:hypothetical protein